MIDNVVIAHRIRERILSRGVGCDDHDAWCAARKISDLLKEKYGAKKVLVFGSLAKRYWTHHSDIDLAVSGIDPRDFFKAFLDAEALADPYSIDFVDIDEGHSGVAEEIEREGVAL